MKKRYEELQQILLDLQQSYYIEGLSKVSDLEYDRLFDELLSLEEKYPELKNPASPSVRIGSDLTNDFEEVVHTLPVLSLDKAYSAEEVLSWMKKSENKKNSNLSFVLEEKIDGVSIVLYYEEGIFSKAVTRGNGAVGNDVSENVKTISSIPLRLSRPLTIAVRGEIYLSKKEFEKLDKLDLGYKNPRNLASGTIRRIKSSEVATVPLEIFIYEGYWDEQPEDHIKLLSELKTLGFRINPHIALFCKTKKEAEEKLEKANIQGQAYHFDELASYLEMKTGKRESLEYEIDGIVSKINELSVREEFGYTEHHPRWAIAYKFESPQAISTVLGVSIQVGRTGRITPVAELEKVKLGGSEIKRATLHNQEYINELELAIGDSVSVVKRGDVIPQVEEILEKKGGSTYIIDSHCPCCNAPLIKKGVHLFCPNRDCFEQIMQRISYFTSRDQMDMVSLGPKSIKLLIDNGLIKDIPDLYTCDFDSLYGVKSIGEKTIQLFKNAVEESKKKPFNTVLSSLGLPEIGKKSASIIIDGGFDHIDKLLTAAQNKDYKSLIQINQIGEQTAKLLLDALSEESMIVMITKLKDAGLQFSKVYEENNEKQIFLNQVWCATGSFENYNPRSLALKEIEKRGGRTTSSITGKTTHLLAGKGGGSKIENAKSLGVNIVSEDDFLILLGKKQKHIIKDEQLSLF